MNPGKDIVFARLGDVDTRHVLEHMRDPRIAAHLPLLTGDWTPSHVTEFVATKEACWERDGLGHWAILVDGEYAGWGGFQKEGDEWDFGLVLRPEYFGHGLAITRKALDFARNDGRMDAVTFLLAPSRKSLGILSRAGADYLGEVEHAGALFRKYRLKL